MSLILNDQGELTVEELISTTVQSAVSAALSAANAPVVEYSLREQLEQCGFSELREVEAFVGDLLEQRAASEHAAVIAKAQELAFFFNKEVIDLLTPAKGKKADGEKKTRAAATAKYMSATDPNLIWTGRGKKPAWMSDFITAGGDPESLRIAA